MPGCGIEGRQWSEDALRLERTAESIWRKTPSFLSREDFPAVVSRIRRVAYSALFCTLQRALPCPRLQAVGKGFWFPPFS
jgi:hypothetical protein